MFVLVSSFQTIPAKFSVKFQVQGQRLQYFRISSHLPTDEALEKETRIYELKKKIKNSPPIPHLLQVQQAPAVPYAKVVGRPGTGSYPAPSHNEVKKKKMERLNNLLCLMN